LLVLVLLRHVRLLQSSRPGSGPLTGRFGACTASYPSNQALEISNTDRKSSKAAAKSASLPQERDQATYVRVPEEYRDFQVHEFDRHGCMQAGTLTLGRLQKENATLETC
jgi:hypothetical protein